MSKILSIDNMLTIARDLELPDYDAFVEKAESVAGELAYAISQQLGVNCENANWMGEDMGGLCVVFRPTAEGQPCPAAIDEADSDGDWE